jgi:hypothetical protein
MFELLAGLSIGSEECHTEDVLNTSNPEVITDSSSDVQEDDLNQDDDIMHTLFDLEALDRLHSQKPVFTKTLLERIADDVARIASEHYKPDSERKLGALHWTSQEGQSVRIWKDVHDANYVTANYMTRIEMSPEFQ